MKILITTDLFSTKTNGVVTSVRNLCDELKARGHEVKILTSSDSVRSKRSDDVYYIRSVPLRVYPDVRMPTAYKHRFVREIIDWKPDVIHSQCEFFSFKFAKYISKKTNAPIIHTYHTLYEDYVSYVIPGKRLGNWVVKKLSKTILKDVDTVIAPTHKIEDKLKSYGMTNPISVIPTGINLTQHKIRISKDIRNEKRAEYGIQENTLLLISLGRLGAEKNLCELINYFAHLSSENDNIMLMIVGDGPEKKNLIHLASTLGIEDKVIFTGMIDPTEVHIYYQLGDIFVNASTSEAQGLTYVEAAANGLPMICRHDPCLEHVIIEGQNGFSYEDREQFCEYVKRFAQDENFRIQAGRASEQIALLFDKSEFGKAIEKLYTSIKS